MPQPLACKVLYIGPVGLPSVKTYTKNKKTVTDVILRKENVHLFHQIGQVKS